MNTSKIKLIAFDLDGTLLNENSHVSLRTQKTLEAAAKKGFILVAATGRVYTSIPAEIGKIPAIQYVISSNGAHIIEQKTRKTVYENLINPKAIRPIYPFLFMKSAMLEVFFEHRGYMSKYCSQHLEEFGVVSEQRKQYVLNTRIAVDNLQMLLEKNIDRIENLKIGFASTDEKYAVNDKLQKFPNLTVVCTQHFDIEIGGKTTSKADALSHLCQLLGLESENCMVFGDSNNDAQMLRFAGLRVAMDNAVDGLKDLADEVCPSNIDDGVAVFIESML